MAPWWIAAIPPTCSMARCHPLRHLVGLLACNPVNSPLATGDIVTTGPLTGAFPIVPGESWGTMLQGIELDDR
jgi:2-keto-4-pentenoate hydratase